MLRIHFYSFASAAQVVFDHVGSLKKYDSVLDILRDFFELRMKYYHLRKDWLTGMLEAESSKLSNQARFILEKIQGTLVIGKQLFYFFCLIKNNTVAANGDNNNLIF